MDEFNGSNRDRTPPGMHVDLRRSHALIRDEGRLRKALVQHEALRFDADTARAVRERTEDLLETVSYIANDADLWERLGRAAHAARTYRALLLSHRDGARLVATTQPLPDSLPLLDDCIDAFQRLTGCGPGQALQCLTTIIAFTRGFVADEEADRRRSPG
jgi:hypothetical protein